MKNVELKVEGNILTIKVDLSKEFGPSSSGKTPILTVEETRALVNSIDTSTIVGLRDKALISVLVFSFARIGAALGMKVEDYYPQGKRWWFRLDEKGGKRHDVPAHHEALRPHNRPDLPRRDRKDQHMMGGSRVVSSPTLTGC